MADYKVNLESILFGYYIKYDRLLELCNNFISDIESDTVDIYVDLYDMLLPIYTTDIYANNKFTIVSSIINLAAHYRGYFATRHGLKTRIFLVYANETSNSHSQFWPSFGRRSHIDTKDWEKNNTFIKTQLELLKILCAYIYDIYYIERSTDFTIFSYDQIKKNTIPKYKSILITKSEYAFQVPAFAQDAVVFRPKKSVDGDTSYGISINNIYSVIYKSSKDTTIERLNAINPTLVSIMLALTGMPKYGLYSICNITAASKMVYNAIISSKISNSYTSDVYYVYSMLDGIRAFIEPDIFNYRFIAIDLPKQRNIYIYTAEYNDISWYINLNDPNTVKEINNRYFIDNPLDLNNL